MRANQIRYWILFFCFTILAGVGTWMVELLEGSKITTTEHIDFWFALWIYGFIGAGVVFGVVMLPLLAPIGGQVQK